MGLEECIQKAVVKSVAILANRILPFAFNEYKYQFRSENMSLFTLRIYVVSVNWLVYFNNQGHWSFAELYAAAP